MIKKLNEQKTTEEIKKILESHKKPHEKKIALFNLVVKKIEVGDMQIEEKKELIIF